METKLTTTELAALHRLTGELKARISEGKELKIEGSFDGIEWDPSKLPFSWPFLRPARTPKEIAKEEWLANNMRVKAECEADPKKFQWLQYMNHTKESSEWHESLGAAWNDPRLTYRIAPKPTYVPWTLETAPKEAWIKQRTDGERMHRFIEICLYGCYVGRLGFFNWEQLKYHFTQLDGTPCGSISEEGK